jgi:hypothetical protein
MTSGNDPWNHDNNDGDNDHDKHNSNAHVDDDNAQ